MASVVNQGVNRRLPLPLLAIVGRRCWECYNSVARGRELRHCGRCQRAFYCDSDCQTKNWHSEHKTLCKQLRRLNERPKAQNKLTWDQYKELQAQRDHLLIERDANGKEVANQLDKIRILFYQPKCESCLRTKFDNVDDDFRLTHCEKCKIAFFCSAACRSDGFAEHRSRQCNDLKEIAASESLLDANVRKHGPRYKAILLPTVTPRTTYKALGTANNWKQYFGEISHNPFADFVTENLKPASDDVVSKTKSMYCKLAVSISTYWMTILAGLEHELSDISSRKHLTIHIIGAEKQTTSTAKMAEELIHLLPSLRKLTLCFVGPGAVESIIIDELLKRCPLCKQGRRPQQMVFQFGCLYHDFIQTESYRLHRPDLIVAFHSGHFKSEAGTWTPTLKKILELGIPALFTTYKKHQAIEEKRILNGMGAHFSQEMERNRWSSVLPLFDTSAKPTKRYDVSHDNEYWYIVKGRRGESGADTQQSE